MPFCPARMAMPTADTGFPHRRAAYPPLWPIPSYLARHYQSWLRAGCFRLIFTDKNQRQLVCAFMRIKPSMRCVMRRPVLMVSPPGGRERQFSCGRSRLQPLVTSSSRHHHSPATALSARLPTLASPWFDATSNWRARQGRFARSELHIDKPKSRCHEPDATRMLLKAVSNGQVPLPTFGKVVARLTRQSHEAVEAIVL